MEKRTGAVNQVEDFIYSCLIEFEVLSFAFNVELKLFDPITK